MKFNHPYYRWRAEKWQQMKDDGMTESEIAIEEGLSVQTVRKELRRLKEETGCTCKNGRDPDCPVHGIDEMYELRSLYTLP